MGAVDSALAQFTALLKSYDLSELDGWAKQAFTDGKSADQVALELRDQKPFRQKYSAIFDREAKGLPPVSVAEIVSYRNQAAQTEHLHGLPTGYLSNLTNVNKLITGDVSMTELTNRVTLASTEAQTVPPEVRQAFQEMYGVGLGGLTAYFADPDHAMPMLQNQFNASQAAGGAMAAGYGPLSASEAEKAAAYGLTDFGKARSAFGMLDHAKQLMDGLPGGDQTSISRDDALKAAGGDPEALKKLQDAATLRDAQFKAGGGFAGRGGLLGADTAH